MKTATGLIISILLSILLSGQISATEMGSGASFKLDRQVSPGVLSGPTKSIVKTPKIVESDPAFLTFNEWRQKMIQDAEKNVLKTESEIAAYTLASKQFTNEPEKRQSLIRLKDLRLKLEIEKMRLTAASDLSMNDYFIGHLMKPSVTPEVALELSERFSEAEVALLVRAFAEMVRKSRHSNLIQATIPAIEQ